MVVVTGDDAGNRRRGFPTTTSSPSTTTAAGPDLGAVSVTLTKIADITFGTALTVRAGDPALYVARQTGTIVAIRDGAVDSTPVLDISGRITAGGEQGLLGIAFSPDGEKLYVHSSAPNGDTRLEEYTFTDGRADPTSARTLLTVAQPQPNHNGGQIAFGPDGLLYLALGDGGGANDEGSGHAPEGNGQSLATLLGKILRFDPSASPTAGYTVPADNPFVNGGGRPEILAYGLRNPWRFSFDSETGDLWIADVGQNAWEEINWIPLDDAFGANFGWPLLEGSHELRAAGAPGTVLPVFEASHDDGNCSVTGGYVYRGTKISDLVGSYVFGDYCNSTISAVRLEEGRVVFGRALGIAAPSISSFGQDAEGELYVISQTEGVFRIDAG